MKRQRPARRGTLGARDPFGKFAAAEETSNSDSLDSFCEIGDAFVSLVPMMSPPADDHRLPESQDFEQQPAEKRCHTRKD